MIADIMILAPPKRANDTGRRAYAMESIYKIIDVVGTSRTSWEEAAKNAVETAGKSLEDLRVAEVVKLDMAIEKNKVVAYRARVNLSFKYHLE
jgi:flavin-binding protein dodecin